MSENNNATKPREWILYSHYSTDHDAMKWDVTQDSRIISPEVETPERVIVIDKSAYDALQKQLERSVEDNQVTYDNWMSCEDRIDELTEQLYSIAAEHDQACDDNDELRKQLEEMKELKDHEAEQRAAAREDVAAMSKLHDEALAKLADNATKPRELEEQIVDIIIDWKHFWMNQHQNSVEDQQNYFKRAFGIDANMQYSLAKKLLPLFDALQKQLEIEHKKNQSLEDAVNNYHKQLEESEKKYENRTPTEWAYNQACAALDKHREENKELTKQLDEKSAEVERLKNLMHRSDQLRTELNAYKKVRVALSKSYEKISRLEVELEELRAKYDSATTCIVNAEAKYAIAADKLDEAKAEIELLTGIKQDNELAFRHQVMTSKLEAENTRLREALEFYADKDNWDTTLHHVPASGSGDSEDFDVPDRIDSEDVEWFIDEHNTECYAGKRARQALRKQEGDGK